MLKKEHVMLRLILFTSFLLVCALFLSAVQSAEGFNPYAYQQDEVAMWQPSNVRQDPGNQ
jgi:hypothetical protein